jgi:hypothetical protein
LSGRRPGTIDDANRCLPRLPAGDETPGSPGRPPLGVILQETRRFLRRSIIPCEMRRTAGLLR